MYPKHKTLLLILLSSFNLGLIAIANLESGVPRGLLESKSSMLQNNHSNSMGITWKRPVSLTPIESISNLNEIKMKKIQWEDQAKMARVVYPGIPKMESENYSPIENEDQKSLTNQGQRGQPLVQLDRQGQAEREGAGNAYPRQLHTWQQKDTAQAWRAKRASNIQSRCNGKKYLRVIQLHAKVTQKQCCSVGQHRIKMRAMHKHNRNRSVFRKPCRCVWLHRRKYHTAIVYRSRLQLLHQSKHLLL